MDREVSKQTLAKERKQRILKLAAIVGGVVAVAIVLLNILQNGVQESSLQFSTAERGAIELTINTSGVVQPAGEEAVVSPISSRLLEVFHKHGDSVTKGTPLLQLDLLATQSSYEKLKDQLQMRILEGEQREAQNASNLSNMQMNLKVMEMQIDQKRIELKNALRLDSLGGGTAGTVRQVEMNLKVAELEREQLKLKITNRSPTHGDTHLYQHAGRLAGLGRATGGYRLRPNAVSYRWGVPRWVCRAGHSRDARYH